MTAEMSIRFDDLVSLLQRVFTRAGVAEENAAHLAANCAMCERDGSLSHGIFRVPGYLSSLKSGWVDGRAVPIVEDVSPAMIRVDARNGFAQPALAAARPVLLDKVRREGVAIVAIRDSHHFSALWPDVEPFAREGWVAMSYVSGLACVVPPGGRRPVFGTNPMAFASPVAGTDPLVFDQATSALSNGDMRIAAREGHDVPAGCGVDRNRQPTADPGAILDGGALLPFGGHKGASIMLMVEILASALTGGQFSAEVDFSKHPGAETPKTGQLLIVVDPERGGNAAFARRVRQLLDTLREAGQERLPGDRRYARRKMSEEHGIPISRTQRAQLTAFAGVRDWATDKHWESTQSDSSRHIQ
jgi:delta1-piperideine-2-carboxylate reductase